MSLCHSEGCFRNGLYTSVTLTLLTRHCFDVSNRRQNSSGAEHDTFLANLGERENRRSGDRRDASPHLPDRIRNLQGLERFHRAAFQEKSAKKSSAGRPSARWSMKRCHTIRQSLFPIITSTLFLPIFSECSHPNSLPSDCQKSATTKIALPPTWRKHFFLICVRLLNCLFDGHASPRLSWIFCLKLLLVVR